MLDLRGLFPRQRMALESGLTRKAQIVLVSGGVQSGKTFIGSRFAAASVLQCKPPYLGWVLSPTYPMSKVPERDFITCGIEHLIVNQNKEDRSYSFQTPSDHLFRVEFKSTEYPDRLRGPALSWIWLDEASFMDEEAWLILIGRVLRTGGTIFITTTPKRGKKSWIYRRIISKFEEGNKRYFVTTLKTSDNRALDPEQVDEIQKEYQGKWAQQELEGLWVDLGGAFFDLFDPKIHVVKNFVLRVSDEIYAAMDFGYGHATCHLWIAKRGDDYIVFDEHLETGKPSRYHAQRIKERPYNNLVKIRYGDPSAVQDMMDLSLEPYNLFFAKANNDRSYGWRRIINLLASGRLSITPNCPHLISQLESAEVDDSVKLDRETRLMKDIRGEDIKKGQPDDALDTLRYFIASFPVLQEEVKRVDEFAHLDPWSKQEAEYLRDYDKLQRQKEEIEKLEDDSWETSVL